MMWLTNPIKWTSLDVTDQLEAIRKHYCTGPCGQSSSIASTRSATDAVLKLAIKEIKETRGVDK
jgi:hypothetical protein|tara:strand:+ start:145 stop:336 length:192 start_codon:yes stop_codon:yes gene_type:complete